MGSGSKKGKFSRIEANHIANKIVKKLKPFCKKIEICGSIRRGCGFVGDIDILAVPIDANKVMDIFFYYGGVKRGEEVTVKGSIIVSRIQADLLLVPEESWGTGLMHSTGSAKLNIIQRMVAKRKGYVLNQYGLFKGKKNLAADQNEEEIYKILGITWKTPQERSI